MSLPTRIEAFHAGRLDILRLCASNSVRLTWSTQRREWLGYGVYFFAYSEAHARRWVDIGARRGWWLGGSPGIIKAEIDLGDCLYVEEPAGAAEVQKAALDVLALCNAAGVPIPQNTGLIDGVPVERNLDCLIFNQVHHNRQMRGEPEIDTILSFCNDGPPIIPGSQIPARGHHQICVRNYSCISKVELVWPPQP